MNTSEIDKLHSSIRGMVLTLQDEQYVKYSTGWNLNAKQNPEVVVVAQSTHDIVAAIRFAGDNKLGVGVMTTGHGIGKPCDGGMLINTSMMRGVTIDPQQRTATVEAGALWSDVIGKAYEHGLATLAGSAPHVGVVGYTMGGGSGYLGRKFGLNSGSVVSAEVVTADGAIRSVSEHHNEELFWAVNGSGGNFGIITSLTFRLYPVTNVYGGAVYYSVKHGREALDFFSNWAETVPDEVTAALAFMNVPDVAAAPPPLRGRSIVAIKGCFCGRDLAQGENIFAPSRNIAQPIADTFGVMPVTAMDAISKDPVDPMGILQYAAMLTDLSASTIDAILSLAGQHAMSPILMLEIRRLGGALETGDNIRMMGSGKAKYSLNAIGASLNPEMAERVQGHLNKLSTGFAPHTTGEVFLNFLEADPSKERVRSAFTSDDWQKLITLKKKFDPDNVFRFNRNIW